MAETTEMIEKHYCYPMEQKDNSALWAALMSKDKSSPMEMAALMNGGGGFGNFNNPWAYIMMMWLMRYMNGWGFGYGDGVAPAAAGVAVANNEALNYNNRAITQLQGTVDANHLNDVTLEAIKGNGAAIHELATTLNCDINTVNQGICAVKSAVESVGANVGFSAERVINAVSQGDSGIISAINTSACSTQKEIIKMGYENQLASERQTNILGSKTDEQTGILGSKIDSFKADSQLQTCQQTNALQSTIYQTSNATIAGLAENRQATVNGFANLGYTLAQDTCAILQGQKDQTAQLKDLLNSHWSQETSQALQDAKFEISQQKQNNYIAGLLASGCNCGGCN